MFLCVIAGVQEMCHGVYAPHCGWRLLRHKSPQVVQLLFSPAACMVMYNSGRYLFPVMKGTHMHSDTQRHTHLSAWYMHAQ